MSISDKAEDKSGEASMDEILASIRKIIADDPNAPRGGPDRRAVNPLLETHAQPVQAPANTMPVQSMEGSYREARPLPPADRLAEAIRTSAVQMRANTEQRQPIRQRPFADHGLDDLMDDALSKAAPVNANVPSFVQSEPHAQGGTWASWRNFKPGAAPAAAPVEPPTLDAAPPLRSAGVNGHGLDQPEPAKPETKQVDVQEPAPIVQPEPVIEKAAAPEPKPALETKPTIEPKPAPEPQAVAPAAPVAPAVRRQPASFASVFPRPERRVPLHAQSAAAPIPAPVAPTPAPIAEASPSPVTHMNGNTPTEVAASQALEKLAAGLSEPPAPIPTEASLVPAAAAPPPVPVQVAAVVKVESAPAPAPAAAAPARTLEDAVTDMLRPMLEKWVEANMPRLMEKALRGDLSKSSKPPGT
jgi:cell pole-organizing protein PopZ